MKPIKNQLWHKYIDFSLLTKLGIHLPRNTICPEQANVFKTFETINPEDVKLMVIGQNPYPNRVDATGVAFAVNKSRPFKEYPYALKVLSLAMMEVSDERIVDNMFDPSLEDYTKKGVMFIDAALTSEINSPKSGLRIWKEWFADFLESYQSNTENVIFYFIGNHAKSFMPIINKSKHHVFGSLHPDSVYRNKDWEFDSKFVQIRKLMEKIHKSPFYFDDLPF